jgi:hypothetical protein
MRWSAKWRHARRCVLHASNECLTGSAIPQSSPSSNPRAKNTAANNETARVRWSARAPIARRHYRRPAARSRCFQSVLILALRSLKEPWRPASVLEARAASVFLGGLLGQTDGIGRSALTFRRLLLSRRPSTLWLDGRCDGNRCYPALSNSLAPGDPGCVRSCTRRLDLTSGSG